MIEIHHFADCSPPITINQENNFFEVAFELRLFTMVHCYFSLRIIISVMDIQNELKKINTYINTLESKQAFQEDVIEQLNQQVIRLQQANNDYEKKLQELIGKIESFSSNNLAADHEETPPPHY